MRTITPCVIAFILTSLSHTTYAHACYNDTKCDYVSGRTDGMFVFAVLLDIHGVSSEGCGNLSISAVQQVEAILKTFDELNQRDYIPGVKLSVRVVDTCGSKEIAAWHLHRMLPAISIPSTRPCTHDPDYIFQGVMGPNRVDTAEIVARMLRDRSPTAPYPQITYGVGNSGSMTHNNLPSWHTTHVFHLVPPDAQLVKAIIELLRKLDWNYIAVVYSDDLYGTNLYTHLKTYVDICIAMDMSLSLTSSTLGDQIEKFFTKLNKQTSNPVTGVVYLGYGEGALRLLEVANKARHDYLFEFIVTNVDDIALSILSKFSNVAPGLFTVSHYNQRLEYFTDHWYTLLRNSSAQAHSISNPWIQEAIMQLGKCKIRNTPFKINKDWTKDCAGLIDDEIERGGMSTYIEYAVTAAHLFAYAAKQVHREACHPTRGVCADLKNEADKFRLHLKTDKVFDYKSEFVNLNMSSKLFPRVLFDKNGNIKWSLAPYKINNLQINKSNRLRFVEIGEYDHEGMRFNQSNKIKMYTWTKAQLSGLTLLKSHCKITCKKCSYMTSFADDILIVPGDYYIVVFVMATHASKTPYICGNQTRRLGLDTGEAARFAINVINEKKQQQYKDVFPGAKLGLIGINTCSNTLVTEKRLVDLHTASLSSSYGRIRLMKEKIIGYVTVATSSTTTIIAATADKMNIVTVASGATSSKLSDRTEYPTFMRVITPDDKQVTAIFSILKHFKWKYIQVIYQNDVYGRGAWELLKKEGELQSVCIAAAHVVSVTNKPGKKLANDLRIKSQARIVIIFAQRSMLKLINNALQDEVNHKGEQEFLFFGSEAWGNSEEVTNDTNVAVGSFTIALRSVPHLGFYKHMENLDAYEYTDNPWLLDYWQQFFECNMPRSFTKPFKEICLKRTRLTPELGYQQDNFSPLTIKSVIALAVGASAVIEQICKNFDGALCPEYFSQVSTVYNKIKGVTYTDNSTAKEMKIFDDNGDGNAGYDIYIIKEHKTVYRYNVYIKVASWSPQNGLEFVPNYTDIVGEQRNVSCTNEYECPQCRDKSANSSHISDEGNTKSWKIVASLFIVLFIVLLIIVTARIVFTKYTVSRDSDYLDVYVKPSELVYAPDIINRRVTGTSSASNQRNNSVDQQRYSYNSANYVELVDGSPVGSPYKYHIGSGQTNVAFRADTQYVKNLKLPQPSIRSDTSSNSDAIISSERRRTPLPATRESDNGSSGCSTYNINNQASSDNFDDFHERKQSTSDPTTIAMGNLADFRKPHNQVDIDETPITSPNNVLYLTNHNTRRNRHNITDTDINDTDTTSSKYDYVSSSGISSDERHSPSSEKQDYLTVVSTPPPQSTSDHEKNASHLALAGGLPSEHNDANMEVVFF